MFLMVRSDIWPFKRWMKSTLMIFGTAKALSLLYQITLVQPSPNRSKSVCSLEE
ncbi:hypothetical protein SynSYN20_03275 [Synechococcus sp. SYN20]|nr:hypothetical protein SynSYN20_03275 [Synechococcus sp. SYN20]